MLYSYMGGRQQTFQKVMDLPRPVDVRWKESSGGEVFVNVKGETIESQLLSHSLTL